QPAVATPRRAAAGLLSDAGARRRCKPSDVGVNHHGNQPLEGYRRRPSEHPPPLGRISDQVVHYRWTREGGIDPHVALPVEPRMAERGLDELLDRVADARCDDVV